MNPVSSFEYRIRLPQMIKCKKSRVTLLDNDILYIDIKKNQEFKLKDYQEVKLASLKLTTGKSVYNLINLGDKTILDREAREACSVDIGNGRIKAEAFVIYSLGQRILARYILMAKRKHVPIRLFTNQEKAMIWLESVKRQSGVE